MQRVGDAVGVAVVGAVVVGDAVVGAAVVGDAVELAVVGAAVVGDAVGLAVVGAAVVGDAVVGAAVIGHVPQVTLHTTCAGSSPESGPFSVTLQIFSLCLFVASVASQEQDFLTSLSF